MAATIVYAVSGRRRAFLSLEIREEGGEGRRKLGTDSWLALAAEMKSWALGALRTLRAIAGR
jgi:hypothetical protein